LSFLLLHRRAAINRKTILCGTTGFFFAETVAETGDVDFSSMGRKAAPVLVPEAGIEPARCCHRQILSLAQILAFMRVLA
jgi:hypothetical protein